jgi:PGF-pre-PGF domain-containing protein
MIAPTSIVGVVVAGNTGTVMGTVANSGGMGVGNANVYIYNEAQNVYSDTTDSNGDYTLSGVKQSNYTLVANHTKYADNVTEDVNVTAGETTTLDVTLEQAVTVTGTVTDSQGNGVANLQVLLDSGNRFYAGGTNQNGKFSLKVPPGKYNGMVFSGGQNYALKNSWTLDTSSDATSGISLNVVQPKITSSSVSVTAGGDGVQTDKLSVDAQIQFGMALVRVLNDNKEDTGMPQDLSSLGVDKDTTFEITMTTENYDPNSLLWAARDVSWSTTTNDDGTVDITVTTKASHLAGINPGKYPKKNLQIGPLMGKNPDNINWPTGSNDKADLGWDRTVYFGLFDLSNMPSEVRDRMGGMTVTTNAQTFMLPRVNDDEMEIWVGGPHKDTEGIVHDGYYEAKIPDSQLSEWGVSTSNPASELRALYKGSEQSATFTDLDDGVKVEMDLSYSSGSVSVEPSGGGGGNNNNPGSGGGGGGGGATGEHLTNSRSATQQFYRGAVSEARVDFDRAINGRVSMRSIDALPSDVPRPDSSVLSSVDITVPDSERDRSATVSLTLSRDAIESAETSPERLRIARLQRGASAPQVLDTTVQEVTEDSVELSARTPGFSVFVVVSTDTADTPTATPSGAVSTPTPPPSTPTPTPQPAATATPAPSTPTPQPAATATPAPSTPTPASGPGFGFLGAVLALLTALVVVRRY